MPADTYIALATRVLTGTDAQIDFANIPNSYRDLVLVMQTSAGPVNIRGKFNDDAGSNYFMARMYGTTGGIGADSFSSTHFEFGDLTAGQSSCTIEIMDYSATNKHKSTISRLASSADKVFWHCNRWASTNAITKVSIYPSSGSWPSGSTFSLYGIASS